MSHVVILTFFNQVDPKISQWLKMIDFKDWWEDKPKAKLKNYYFFSLLRNIVGQQLSTKAANAIWGRVVKTFEAESISPQMILAKDDNSLRMLGLSNAKVKYAKNIAQAFITKVIDEVNLEKWNDEKIIEHLITIKGVGRWTAEMFLMFTLKRENVYSYGDLGLKKGFMKVYSFKNYSEKRVRSVIKRWEPYKTYGALALWKSLEKD